MIRRQCVACGVEAERECHICWDSYCPACGETHDCEPELTGITIIQAALGAPQRTLTEENLLRFMREDMVYHGIRPPQVDVALYTLHREDGSPLPVNGIEGREPELRTLVQQYYARGGRLSAAEQATVDLFDTQATRQFLADFAGDPLLGPSLRRLYPDMAFDCYDPSTIKRWPRIRAPRTRRKLRSRSGGWR